MPRDVPPENFVSVPETVRVVGRGRGVARAALLLLVLLATLAGLGAGGWLLYTGVGHQEKEAWGSGDHKAEWAGQEAGWGEQQQGDQPAYRYQPVQGNTTLYLRLANPCASQPCQAGGTCESHDGEQR